jgi:hypothetical protein
MKILNIWGQKFRFPTAYEVRVDLLDDEGRVRCECLRIPTKNEKDIPDEKTIDLAVNQFVEDYEARESLRIDGEVEMVEVIERQRKETVCQDFTALVDEGKIDKAVIDKVAVAMDIASAKVDPIKRIG